MTSGESTAVHPFERAGLGVAPFRFGGIEAQDLRYGEAILNRAEYERTGVALTTRPGGTCAFCGTAITVMYGIIAACGRRFHVGSECVRKTGDRSLVADAACARRKRDRTKRHARERAILATLPALIFRARRQLRASAVPSGPAKGRPALPWAVWIARHGQTTARLRVARLCARLMGDR